MADTKKPEPYAPAAGPIGSTSGPGKEPQSVRDAYDKLQGGKK